MMKKVKELFTKYKEFVLYAIFGVLTTLANLFAFLICTKLFGEGLYLFNNAVAWFAGVVVAFVTNKLYVFNSKSWKPNVAVKEFLEFVAARLFSFGFEEVGLVLFISILHLGNGSFTLFGFTITGQLIIKLILSVFVVIFNYLFSKFFIFKKNEKK